MDYGLSVTNDYGSVIISSSYKVLVFSERGLFQITSRYSDREGAGEVTFAKPVLTQEPPQVFVRHIKGRHNGLAVYTTLRGSAGNWTGFKVTSAAAGGDLQNHSMEYVTCKYSDKSSTDVYGLEVYDEQGKIAFTSSDRVVKYNKFTRNWRWQQFGGRSPLQVFHSDLAIDADDFISISSIDRGVSWYMDGVDYAGLRLLDGGKPVLAMTINAEVDQNQYGGYWYQGTNGTSFAIPVCKFPIEKYYN